MIFRLLFTILLFVSFCFATQAQYRIQSKLIQELPQELRKEARLTKQERSEIYKNHKGLELKQQLRQARTKKITDLLAQNRASQRKVVLPKNPTERKAFLEKRKEQSVDDGLTREQRLQLMLDNAEKRKQKRLDRN